MIKVLIVITITLLLNIRCSINEYSIDKFEPKLVIEGFLNNKEKIRIKISSNAHPNDTVKQNNISNANVRVWEDGLELGLMQYDGNGIYTINYNPKNNHSYKIIVSYPNYPTVEASTYIPDPISSIFYQKKIDTLLSYQVYHTFNIKKQKDLNNRYLGFQFLCKYYYKIFCTDITSNIKYITFPIRKPSDEFDFFIPYMNHNDSDYFNIHTQLITSRQKEFISGDVIFGQAKNFLLSDIPIKIYEQYNKPINTIIIYDISPEVYNYFKSIAIYQENTKSSLTTPFLPSTAITSNIKNGLGIFGYIFTYEFQIDSIPTSCF